MEKIIDEILGKPVDISEIEKGQSKSYTKVAFELYKETASVSVFVSHLFESYGDKNGYLERNQALCAGLIIRIAKLMKSVLNLLIDRVSEHGETIITINRCIIESAVKLKFFCEKATEQDFDNFVKSSLKPEKEAYQNIKDKIQERGEELPIEKRMLDSIERTFKRSGYSIDDLNQISGFKNYKDILIDLGMESAYPFIQGIGSHSIHGDWVEILLHNIKDVEGGFVPKPESLAPNSKVICPINELILNSITSYLHKYFSHHSDVVSIISARIDDLRERNLRVDKLHEDSLNK
jgi:hypothetical protein